MTFGISHRIIASVVLLALAGLGVVCLPSCVRCGGGSFDVDSLVYERSWALRESMENDPLGGRSHFYVKIDYPKQAGDMSEQYLVDSVSAWLSNQLLPEEGSPVMSKKVLEVAANTFFGDTDGNEWGEEVSYSLRKTYEDGEYLSYEKNRYSYNGGAHGSYSVSGATFRKSDGSRVEWSDIEAGDDLRRMVTEELRRIKGEDDEAVFKASILLDADDCTLGDGTFALPLPEAAPWLTEQGWVFTYQPYEILPWCHGAPACCIRALKVE